MTTPKPDDFRVERGPNEWVVTFAPTGARFSFGDDGEEKRASESDVPPEAQPGDFDPVEVEQMAAQLAAAARGHVL
jgi:ribosomal protein L16 Arg81 hydroxylase